MTAVVFQLIGAWLVPRHLIKAAFQRGVKCPQFVYTGRNHHVIGLRSSLAHCETCEIVICSRKGQGSARI